MFPAAAMLQEIFTGAVPEVVKAIIPAAAVYFLTQRNINRHKEQSRDMREEARKEIAEALKPALQLFKAEFTDELLKRMNGTYLRSDEARIHFGNIADSATRLEKNQQHLSDTVNSLAATIGRRKTD